VVAAWPAAQQSSGQEQKRPLKAQIQSSGQEQKRPLKAQIQSSGQEQKRPLKAQIQSSGQEQKRPLKAQILESHSSHWEIRGFGTPQQAQQVRRSWPESHRHQGIPGSGVLAQQSPAAFGPAQVIAQEMKHSPSEGVGPWRFSESSPGK